MTKVRARGEDIRKFILEHVGKKSSTISRYTSEKFGITRQAVNKHLQKLVIEQALSESGNTKNRIYKLASLSTLIKSYEITPELAEDTIWSSDIRAALGLMPENVLRIWHHGFTEMFNNAIDHSEGSMIVVSILKTAISTIMIVSDNGVGIFKKIQKALKLLDERHAIFELAKGKLTTDRKRHSGEGIFFTSRMLDSFSIISGECFFDHKFGEPEDWVLEMDNNRFPTGTVVIMALNNHTARTTKKIFDQFSSGQDYGFNKTVVPVKMAKYGDDQLISRSQAKRLLARVELFKTVLFDFKDIDFIGQAFADEIFRVFASQHPEIELLHIHSNSEVKRMISRAKSGLATKD